MLIVMIMIGWGLMITWGVVQLQKLISSRSELGGILFLLSSGGISLLVFKLAKDFLFEICSEVDVLGTAAGIVRSYSTNDANYATSIIIVGCILIIGNLILVYTHSKYVYKYSRL